MSRLIVFGCSLAYGVGLPDCWPTVSKPSRLSWTQLTADAMHRILINNSIPGASNKLIWHTINNFKFYDNDVVIVSWSFPNRHSVLTTLKSWKNLHHNCIDTDPAAKAYYSELHAIYDSYAMSALHVDHANRICNDKNLPVYHLVVEKWHSSITGNIKQVPLYMGEYEDDYPKALDNDHLGVEGQVAFAADLMDYIGVKHTLVKSRPSSIFKKIKKAVWK